MIKRTRPEVKAHSIGHQVDAVMRFIADPSPRKTRSDPGVVETVTTRNIRNIKRQLLKKPEHILKAIFASVNRSEASKSMK